MENTKKPNFGIHIFRRDLRIPDNRNLQELAEKVDAIIPVFILTKKQILENRLRNDNFVQFLLEALEDLDIRTNGNLLLLHDFDRSDKEIENWEILAELVREFDVSCLSFMFDYTPYSRIRDKTMVEVLDREKQKLEIINLEDTMLYPISEKIRTDTGNVYQKFTPFYNKVTSEPNFSNLENQLSGDLSTKNVEKTQSKFAYFRDFLEKTGNTLLSKITRKNKVAQIRDIIQTRIDFSPITSKDRKIGTRSEGIKILREIKEGKFKKYDSERDYPAKAKTTRLSAYLKLGLISVREAAKIILRTDNLPLFRELVWRDFYYSISYHFPHVLLPLTEKNMEGKRNFDKSKPHWKKASDSGTTKISELLEKWKTGQTGFPIVDAGMRQLNSIGWMHNRIRMVVASFLIKDLNINWQEGEKYFAQKLIDYDPSQNNGGWQWVHGSGVDSQPYNRIFNPWEQAKKWDPEAEYIKYWVPELSFYPVHIIHNWDKVYSEIISSKRETGKKYYVAPMVNHAEARVEFLESYDK